MRHGAGVALTPVPPTATAVFFGASYHADYATILAAPDDLPAVAERARRLLRAEPPDRRALGRRRPAPAALRRPGGRRAGRGVRARARSPRAGRSTSSARTCARSSTCRSADRWTTILGDARQEGASRDPAQGPSGRGGRRDPVSRTRPTRSPTSRRSSTCTRSAGARTACSRRHAGRRAEPGPLPAAVRAVRAGRAARLAFLTVGGRRIAAGVAFRDAATGSCTTTPASTRMRATCRRAS